MAAQDNKKLTLFSPEDPKNAQKELDRLRKRLNDNENAAQRVKRKRTGFEDKTLWDKLNLFGTLAIPIVVLVATIMFGWWQVHLADLQHQSDQQNSLDQQRQATLVGYLDNMKDLLLSRGLLTPQPSDEEIQVIARTETLSAMRQLDGKRNNFLIQFLKDSYLIGFDHNVINFGLADLSGVDLSGVDFSNVDLSFVNLSGADLNNADFSFAHLDSANLSKANLSGANFTFTTLDIANFSGANLSKAFFDETNLSHVLLSDAVLDNALLYTAIINQDKLDQVYSCKNAVLPQGLTCHNNG